jgi:EAL domain-containing protein (putative c-di-GMP-specific phosphodiesterase class I)
MDKQHIYANIVIFARNLGTRVLAEGIETEAEFQTLLNLGMDYAQGYLIGKPLSTLEPVNLRVLQMIQEYQAQY